MLVVLTEGRSDERSVEADSRPMVEDSSDFTASPLPKVIHMAAVTGDNGGCSATSRVGLRGVAAGADEAVRPAQFNQRSATRFPGREAGLELPARRGPVGLPAGRHKENII